MLKVRSVPGLLMWTRSARLHPALQRHHRAGHLAVVQRADVEIQVLEGLGAHAGGLGHAGRRPAQHAPAGLAHAIVEHRASDAGIERHPIAGHVGVLGGVAAAANGDVGLHLLHPEQLEVAHQAGVLVVCRAQHLAVDARVADFDDRRRAGRPRRPHQFDRELIGHVDHVQQDAVALLQCGGVFDQQPGQLRVARISHKES